LKLSLVQMGSIAGDVPANLTKHVETTCRAVDLGAEVVVFPELSLTGYEPTLASRLAAQLNDPRFDRLQTLSDFHSIVICTGMPLAVDDGIAIGMLLFQPGTPRLAYSKQLLHADEYPYFVPGNAMIQIQKGGHNLAPAICFESLQPEHAESAASSGADVYLASVAKSPIGVDKAYCH
jgi:predicted amidohydrolase